MKESNSNKLKLELKINKIFSHKRKGQFELAINLELPLKGITGILGHSGSGKTTLLRSIAGLEELKDGQISIGTEVWNSSDVSVPTYRRSIGYVFQEASIFEHLTGQENLDFALKRADVHFEQDFFDKIIDTLGIKEVLSRFPSQMSGGERQRVAIARAILTKPKLLLMDEPLAALDIARKKEILSYLEEVRSKFDIPIIYVSHSLNEIARLSDHVVMLENGKVIAQGLPTEVFSRIDLPVEFEDDLGVVLEGKVVEKDKEWQLNCVQFDQGKFWIKDHGEELNRFVRARILARDVSITLNNHQDTSILNKIPAVVSEIVPDKDESMSLIRLSSGRDTIIARITNKSLNALELTVGMKVCAQVKSVALVH